LVVGSLGTNDPSLKQIELPASIHLSFYELELGDLSLGLAVRPGRGDRSGDGRSILEDAIGERRDEAGFRPLQPWIDASERRLRTMAWKVATISRASTNSGTPVSTTATMTVSDLDRSSRSAVRSRAIVRAAGTRASALSVLSAWRRRAHVIIPSTAKNIFRQ
jgi:hypothetical protein